MKPQGVSFFVPLLFIVTVVSCSKEGTKPEPQNPTDQLIGSASIGSSGGRISADDFVLEVPAGAFAEERTLRLYHDSSGSPFHGGAASATFRIEGLPQEFVSPIACRMRLSSDTPSRVAIGEEIFRHGESGTRVGWRFLDGAQDSSGWCLWELPPIQNPGKRAANDSSSVLPVHVTGVTGYGDYTTPAGHFRICYSAGAVTLVQATQLGDYLEGAFNYYASLGFVCTRSWPVEVTLDDLESTLYGGWNASGWGINSCSLEFNSLYIGDPDLRITVGHEIFHMFQYFYDPRSSWAKASKGGPLYWLDEAAAVWSEEKFTDAPDTYVSVARDGNQLNPLSGLYAGIAADPEAHGYGMSSLIRSLVRRQGSEAFLFQTYSKVLNGTTPIPALMQSISTPLPQIWGDYLSDLMAGGPYGDVTGNMARDNRSGLFSIASAADTAATFTASYPDLSGRLYLVRLTYAQIGSDAALLVKAAGTDKRIAAYRYQTGQPLTLLSADADSVIVPGLKSMQSAGAGVIVLLANDFASNGDCSGSRPLTLQMRLKDIPDLSKFHLGFIDITYRADWGSGGIVPDQQLLFSANHGHFQGNLFVAEWDSTDVNRIHYVGHIYGTLNMSDLSLHDWTAENRWTYAAPNTYNLYQASGTRIQLYRRLYGMLDYTINGAGACGAITNIAVTQVTNGVVSRNLVGHSCTSESSITVQFMGDSIGTYPR